MNSPPSLLADLLSAVGPEAIGMRLRGKWRVRARRPLVLAPKPRERR